ncbi:type IV secretion system DNA-binding domain-containing protein, partial [Blastomonas sp. CCH5-A3]
WMDLAVNALFHMGRTRDLRTWFLIDEVHALHRLPAIDHGLQTARAFGGAFVLGMHSFDKLEETYGENGATNLASLAGTKLILKTADPETSRRCSEFIGNRQVRIMDEAYSYGYNDNRDASTITPRTNVEELVMPVDISDLPSMHGFVKFP